MTSGLLLVELVQVLAACLVVVLLGLLLGGLLALLVLSVLGFFIGRGRK
jgi:hypothetical protein